jgi:hypothetical protein
MDDVDGHRLIYRDFEPSAWRAVPASILIRAVAQMADHDRTLCISAVKQDENFIADLWLIDRIAGKIRADDACPDSPALRKKKLNSTLLCGVFGCNHDTGVALLHSFSPGLRDGAGDHDPGHRAITSRHSPSSAGIAPICASLEQVVAEAFEVVIERELLAPSGDGG